jgi:hypothetical protein
MTAGRDRRRVGIDGDRQPSIPEPLDEVIPRPSVRLEAGTVRPPAGIGRVGLDRAERCRRLDIGPKPVGIDSERHIDVTAQLTRKKAVRSRTGGGRILQIAHGETRQNA